MTAWKKGRALAISLTTAALFCACAARTPGPEGPCTSDTDCARHTPTCARGVCTRSCSAEADCADLEDQTSCNAIDGVCDEPCTEHAVGEYACVAGQRISCDSDPTLPCSACPNVCGEGNYCEGRTCQPQHASGEPCSDHVECLSGGCSAAGRCSVAQGAACTDDDCEGVCAEWTSGPTAGETVCIRTRCPSDCASSTAGGREWYCARYNTGAQACVPVNTTCIDLGPCGLRDSICDRICSGGDCTRFCIPDAVFDD